jgi:hypothetical protein
VGGVARRERGVVEQVRRDCERERERRTGGEGGDKKARAGSVVGMKERYG